VAEGIKAKHSTPSSVEFVVPQLADFAASTLDLDYN